MMNDCADATGKGYVCQRRQNLEEIGKILYNKYFLNAVKLQHYCQSHSISTCPLNFLFVQFAFLPAITLFNLIKRQK